MWILTAGLGGLAVAMLIWRIALKLAPDARGQTLSALPLGRRRIAMLITMTGGTTGAALVATIIPERPAAIAFALFAAVTPGLAVIDAVTHRLPFIASGNLGAALVVSFGWDAAWSGMSGPSARAGWAGLIVGVLALFWWWFFDGGVGLGDVVLLAVIAAFAGWWSWTAVWLAIAVGFVLAAVAAGVARWRTARAGAYLPLGPFLLAGWWATFALYTAGWIGQPTLSIVDFLGMKRALLRAGCHSLELRHPVRRFLI